ncbi:carbohydrate-binding domain-containing protein [Clostridium sp. LP20]|uniref:carbohydrate-binding domain-containing protein n=1 Tax=Clostridium sp. LP20 TaxID=3418665 RepID=UPI003EE44FB5
MKRKLILMITMVALTFNLVACTSKKDDTGTASITDAKTIQMKSIEDEVLGEVDTFIELGDNIFVNGSGATASGNKVKISKGGTYSLSGTLNNGQVIVDSDEKVYLVLNGVNITCSNSSAINVVNAKKTIIALAESTENTLSDGENYVFEDSSTDEPNAALFSKDDLTIIGTGSLTVNGNYKNGITSKDDLVVQSGNISVKAVEDGLRGRDSITVKNGDITINAGGDGVKSNNDENLEKGYIWILDGKLNITSGEDGIQAETQALISNGDITITTAGGSKNSSDTRNETLGNWGPPDKDMGSMGEKPDKNMNDLKEPPDRNIDAVMENPEANNAETTTDEVSAKGLKASTKIIIDNGNINIDSLDDSIHSNDELYINNGKLNLASGDDGIHSDKTLEINGGDIDITKSYEGIESETITINAGNIKVLASDDGINAAGGNDGSSVNGRPGQNNFASSGNGSINISGGYIVVDASGDGIDSNGNINMKDGVLLVNGPTNGGNGALDYDGTFEITGGTLVAAGSIGMAQTPSDSSTINSVGITLTSQSAGTLIHIEEEDGEEVITFAPTKVYQSVVVASSKLKKDSNYNVFVGGKATGTVKDGLYSDGSYSEGEKAITFSVSGTVTNASVSGVSNGGNNGMGPGGDRGPKGNGEIPSDSFR